MGENITLNCSMRNRYEVSWYHLRSEELVLLIFAEKDKTGRKFLIKYNQNSNRLNITADSLITTVSLVISGVSESDLGLYFCGTKSDTPEMHFDKPIRLQLEDQRAGNTFQFFTSCLHKLVVEGENGLFYSHFVSKTMIVESNKADAFNNYGVTVTERVLMFGGVGLAVFVFFLTTVVAGGIRKAGPQGNMQL
ncbi:hypothetical protein ABG768_012366 [Culter alburnus]|uniref:Ig-like domain-containing protein n=1 Tax=Culter alburnus TaxID=194366 RepID=A0AAW1ZDS0_CULAL